VQESERSTWTISRQSGASGEPCVNRHNAKSMSSMAVPEVNPRISRSRPGLFCSAEGEGELEVSESPLTLDCNASRYLCPTGVRTRPFGAGISPFMTVTIANLLSRLHVQKSCRKVCLLDHSWGDIIIYGHFDILDGVYSQTCVVLPHSARFLEICNTCCHLAVKEISELQMDQSVNSKQ
jgi:hypothetical protein